MIRGQSYISTRITFLGGVKEKADKGNKMEANLRCPPGLDLNIERITPLEHILDSTSTDIARDCHPKDALMSNSMYSHNCHFMP